MLIDDDDGNNTNNDSVSDSGYGSLPVDTILATDGVYTVLKEPIECKGCHTMHFWYIRTGEGHRCVSCVVKEDKIKAEQAEKAEQKVNEG